MVCASVFGSINMKLPASPLCLYPFASKVSIRYLRPSLKFEINESRTPLLRNVSWVNDGSGWKDVTLKNYTVSLKAYTKPLVNLTTEIKAYNVKTAYNGNQYLIVNVKDVFGDAIKAGKTECYESGDQSDLGKRAGNGGERDRPRAGAQGLRRDDL